MATDILAEALARVEHKLDILLRHLDVGVQPQMHFPGQVCPACKFTIDYQVDIIKGVVVRKCKCSTGKMASMIPLAPVAPQGTQTNGTSSTRTEYYDFGEAPSKDSKRR